MAGKPQWSVFMIPPHNASCSKLSAGTEIQDRPPDQEGTLRRFQRVGWKVAHFSFPSPQVCSFYGCLWGALFIQIALCPLSDLISWIQAKEDWLAVWIHRHHGRGRCLMHSSLRIQAHNITNNYTGLFAFPMPHINVRSNDLQLRLISWQLYYHWLAELQEKLWQWRSSANCRTYFCN